MFFTTFEPYVEKNEIIYYNIQIQTKNYNIDNNDNNDNNCIICYQIQKLI